MHSRLLYIAPLGEFNLLLVCEVSVSGTTLEQVCVWFVFVCVREETLTRHLGLQLIRMCV